jgi:hypothetical protein
MTLLAIPNAINAAVTALSHHGHKKGAQGTQNSSSSLDSTSSSGDQSGSAQSLFGSLLDSAEQMVGIQTPTSVAPATVAPAVTNANASQHSPTAAMISAARAALQKV